MNTLREIGVFVGIPQGSIQVARYSGSRITQLRMVSLFVTNRERPASMRAIIQALQNLTPITLEAQIVGIRSGEGEFEKYEPVIRLNASGGIPWFTTIEYSVDGKVTSSHDVSSSGGDFTPTQLGPGNWQIVVSRSGISNTGFVSLNKTLDTITVPAGPIPHPPPPVVQKPPPPPFISVQSNGDGSFKVSGSGFVPKNATVNILVGDGTLRNPLTFVVSATDGAFKDFPTGKICQRQGDIFFEASDGRIDHGSQVFSNTVKISCPF